MKLRGCGTALVTPFKSDGSIDEPALRSLVEWQIESNIHFLVSCGTTGETPTLTREEWLRVIPDFWVATGEPLMERGGGNMMALFTLPLTWPVPA